MVYFNPYIYYVHYVHNPCLEDPNSGISTVIATDSKTKEKVPKLPEYKHTEYLGILPSAPLGSAFLMAIFFPFNIKCCSLIVNLSAKSVLEHSKNPNPLFCSVVLSFKKSILSTVPIDVSCRLSMYA